MSGIQYLGEGIYRIPIPVPFPFKYVYCYLLSGTQGWNIIDAGLHCDQAIHAWQSAFAELGVRGPEVNGIYITHFHPDHFGLAAWMQEHTGASVYMNQVEIEMVNRVWASGSTQADEIGAMCREHGTPVDLSHQITSQMQRLGEGVRIPKLSALSGRYVDFGNREWEIVITPGHSDGHTCFYQPELQTLLSADHILDPITPNISTWPNCCKNPLRYYFDSLKKVNDLGVRTALSAHHEVINDPRSRTDQIMEHHEKRLHRMFQLAQSGKSAFDVAADIFKHRELNAHQWRFAIAETISHLDYLLEAGKLAQGRENGILTYFSA